MKRKLPSWVEEQAETETVHKSPKVLLEEDEAATKEEESDEEDYLSMTFDTGEKASSLLSKHDRERLKRADKGRERQPTEEERAHQAREEALAKPIHAVPTLSKAMRMMNKMGYQEGTALGVQESFQKNALKEPLAPSVLAERGGIGLAAEQKRQFMAQVEAVEAEEHATEEGYREAVRTEKETRRLEGQLHAAQGVCERLDVDTLGEEAVTAMHRVNVLWRSRVRHRQAKERERLLRQQMLDHALSFTNRQFNDEDALEHINEDAAVDEEQMMERRRKLRATLEEEGEEEADEELDAFEALDVGERLDRVLIYLRETYSYCFWCGHRYKDKQELDELCPGPHEEAH
ncbi:hypothetical protein BCR37DRAFT_393022 [Protomyces lactucae-debilis]|uniref:G-patch domain-containing protein n=1 Tax=Protomyces lactucae-debilis TaxID=2754530 RepID=A0A1Y2FGN7_PROLT|nr:uncharacterized protein BCR37DRAFT_393022 [Protomyces lactucae-debilis]ORY81975.1 hypothetical protein BCR37DRAFT_393022 [Protomyces lactucae-debilis]